MARVRVLPACCEEQGGPTTRCAKDGTVGIKYVWWSGRLPATPRLEKAHCRASLADPVYPGKRVFSTALGSERHRFALDLLAGMVTGVAQSSRAHDVHRAPEQLLQVALYRSLFAQAAAVGHVPQDVQGA